MNNWRFSFVLILLVALSASIYKSENLRSEVSKLRAEKKTQRDEINRANSELASLRTQYSVINLVLGMNTTSRIESEKKNGQLKKELNNAQIDVQAASSAVPDDVIDRLRNRAAEINAAAAGS